ncbi:hypothetical protein CNMCM8714_006192 [Aspergillus fumigatus]|nr:hypothetical protein CNMCM8714_006192 [Aspergillus fumigatus]
MTQSILTTTQDGITTITINRPHRRNAVDPPTAKALYNALLAFDADPAHRTVPPSMSGTPHRRQKTPRTASSSTTRRSASSASSSPPATAWPAIAAIRGLDKCSRVGPIGPRDGTCSFLPDATGTGWRFSWVLSVDGEDPVPAAATAWRSAPAQKVPPAPVRMQIFWAGGRGARGAGHGAGESGRCEGEGGGGGDGVGEGLDAVSGEVYEC